MKTKLKPKRIQLIKIFVLILAFIVMLSATNISAQASTVEKILFPMKYLRVTNTDHDGKIAMDFGGYYSSDGVHFEDVYAPFTGTIKYKETKWNTVWFESNEKVEFADGSVDYCTLVFMHDNDISNLSVGKVISQGTVFYQEGGKGPDGPQTYSTHLHLECMKGRVGSQGWGARGNLYAYNVLYLKPDTVVLNGKGYNWKTAKSDTELPTGSWASPANGAILRPSNTLALTVNATDNVNMAKVVFYANYDGSWHELGTDSHGGNGTYSLNWTYNLNPQDVLIHAHLYDTSGNLNNIQGPTVKLVSLPGAPTLSVPATNFTTGSVKFSWNATTNTTHYDLRVLQKGVVIKFFTIRDTSYSLSLPAGDYTAYLCSVNSNYTEWWTKGNDVSFSVVVPPSKPSIPSSLKASCLSYNSIKLTWSAVSGANGYRIYRASNSSGPYTSIAHTSSNSYTNEGLLTGATYYYKVCAYKTVQTAKLYGDQTSAVSTKTVLGTPSNQKAVAASYNSVKLTWKGVPGASGYSIYKATSSSGTYDYVGNSTSGTYTNTGLTTGKTYYYKIRAYHIEGTNKVYGNASGYTSAKPELSTPGSFMAQSQSYNSIKLSWKAVSGASGYTIYRATSEKGTYSYVGTTSSTSYTNTGIETGKKYYYKVRAYRTQGSAKVNSNYTLVQSATPVPAKPSSINAVKASASSIKLSWSSVSGASVYEVHRATSSSGSYSYDGATASTSYTDYGLTAGKTYYYKVRAYHLENGNKIYGSYTSVVSVRLPAQVTMPNVTGMSWTSAQAKLISLGLSISKTEAWSDTVPAQTVISQGTKEGTQIYEGTSVTLTVSKGPALVSVPKLIGLSKDQAQAALSSAGLSMGLIWQPYRWEYAYNSVFEQSIAAGTSVARGTFVNLSVSNGAKPIQVNDWVEFAGGRLYVSSTGTSGVDKAACVMQITDALTNGRWGVRYQTTGGRYGWADANLISQRTN